MLRKSIIEISIGTKIAKRFDDDEVYTGSIVCMLPSDDEDKRWWHVKYEDSDSEDMDEEEILQKLTSRDGKWRLRHSAAVDVLDSAKRRAAYLETVSEPEDDTAEE